MSCSSASSLLFLAVAMPRARSTATHFHDVVLGVDGGGTGTTCAAEIVGDPSARAWFGRSGPANANSVGFETAVANVAEAIRGALRDACAAHPGARMDPLATRGVSRCASSKILRLAAVFLGCAGCDDAASRARFHDALRGILPGLAPRRARVDVDAIAPFPAAGVDPRGVVLIAGTGTVAMGFGGGSYLGGALAAGEDLAESAEEEAAEESADEAFSAGLPLGERRVVAGMGPAFDDVGSGHWIGSRVLAELAKMLDGREEPCASFIARVSACAGIATPDEDVYDDDVHDDARKRRRNDYSTIRSKLVAWAYASGPAPAWDRVAALAPALLDPAEETLKDAADAVALGRIRAKVLGEAARGLAESARAARVATTAAREPAPRTSSRERPAHHLVCAGGLFADDAFFDAVRRELERLDANRADAFARILRVPRERDAIARGAAKVAAAVARAEDARARRADARLLAILDARIAEREREGKRRRT
jgi:N-acetylglucosamine kinase-like BadF-type ATPase